MKKLLVVEDAGPDRRRFRMILDHALRRLKDREKEEVTFEFAWSASRRSVLWHTPIVDRAQFRTDVEGYDYVFLDLAWTKREEDVMNKAKRQSDSWLSANADEWTSLDRLELSASGLRGRGLVEDIGGFAFLEALNEGRKPETRVTVTTNFYSPAIATFCAERWGVTTFHKWEDEDKVAAFVLRAFR